MEVHVPYAVVVAMGLDDERKRRSYFNAYSVIITANTKGASIVGSKDTLARFAQAVRVCSVDHTGLLPSAKRACARTGNRLLRELAV